MTWRIAALAGVLLLASCGTDERSAGKGVITETTNAPAARGVVRTVDSVAVVSGTVQVVRADDVPEAWNGVVRSSAPVDGEGGYRVAGLVPAAFEVHAVVRDARGRLLQGKVPFILPEGDSLVSVPEIVAGRASVLQGRFAAYDSVVATLDSGWRLRSTARGLGAWVFLDSLGGWAFHDVAAGVWRVRIQKVDGIPGHETTLWEGDVVAP
jgi:hypothetical protein